MRALVIDALLVVLVLAVWLGCLGFARLRTAYDRVHCVTFVSAAAGLPLLVTGFVSDGASDRAFKILLLVAVQLLAGAAIAHATGRALLAREQGEREPP